MNNGTSQPRELVDDVIRQLRECGERWHQFKAMQRRRFPEDYLRNDVGLYLTYQIRGAAPQYVAIFERQITDRGRIEATDVAASHCGAPVGTTGHARTVNLNHVGIRENDQQQMVLVHDVQVVNDGQTFITPSEVRFERAEDFFDISPRSWYFPPDYSRPLLLDERSSPSVPDGKHGVLVVFGGYGPGQIVKSRPKGMDHVTGTKTHLRKEIGRGGFRNPDDQMRMSGLFGGLRVFIQDNWISIRPPRGVEFGFEIVDLFVGPFEPSVYTREIEAPLAHGNLPPEDVYETQEETRQAAGTDAGDARGRDDSDTLREGLLP